MILESEAVVGGAALKHCTIIDNVIFHCSHSNYIKLDHKLFNLTEQIGRIAVLSLKSNSIYLAIVRYGGGHRCACRLLFYQER